MSSELKTRIQALYDVDRNQSGWVRNFEDALAKVNELKDKDSIIPLIALLDDNTEYDEAMFSIVHSVEAFPNETYLNALMLALPSLCNRSPRWASIMLMRVLNSEPTTQKLKIILQNCSDLEKKSMSWLIGKIEDVSDEFVPKTQSLRGALTEVL